MMDSVVVVEHLRIAIGSGPLILNFDEKRWSELEEYLKVARLCGENADGLYGPAKGVLQRVVATIGSDKDVSPAEAEHALNILGTLRDSSLNAARCYGLAVTRIDELIQQLEPPVPKIKGRGTKASL